MQIEIEGDTPTQYRLRVSFSEPVNVYSRNRYLSSNGNISRKFHCNMKKLNLKDFLSKYSKSFKREVTISHIVD